MITGRVNSDREAVISLAVSGPQGETREIEAVIDTGYAGYLTLPGAVITALNLSSLGLSRLTLAGGSELPSDVCLATVDWDGRARTVVVDTLESEALVGIALLEGYDLNIRIAVGGRVAIESFLPTQPPNA